MRIDCSFHSQDIFPPCRAQLLSLSEPMGWWITAIALLGHFIIHFPQLASSCTEILQHLYGMVDEVVIPILLVFLVHTGEYEEHLKTKMNKLLRFLLFSHLLLLCLWPWQSTISLADDNMVDPVARSIKNCKE